MLKNLARRLFFLFGPGTVRINNEKIYIPAGLYRHFNLIKNNDYEAAVYRFMERKVLKGDTVVDVGANLGILSLAASRLAGPDGKVFAFEPNPAVFGFMVNILNRNARHKNFYCFQVALDDQNGFQKFMLSHETELMETSGLIRTSKNQTETRVLCSRLDDMIDSDSMSPRWIKIDVEGAEMRVLRGAAKIISRCRPGIILEVHGLYFENPEKHVREVFDFFRSIGYDCFNIHKNMEEELNSFLEDNGTEVYDPILKRNSARTGYGNLYFYPRIL